MDIWCPLSKCTCNEGKLFPDGDYSMEKTCAFWFEDCCLQIENLKKNLKGILHYREKKDIEN